MNKLKILFIQQKYIFLLHDFDMNYSLCIVSVLPQNEGGIGKSIPDAQKIS